MENDLSMGAAWMNGKVLPISQATIPVNDWGLVHSDITYDVVPVIDGAFFRFEEYLARFHSSMESLHLNPGMSKRDIGHCPMSENHEVFRVYLIEALKIIQERTNK